MYCSTTNQREEQQGMASAHMDTAVVMLSLSRVRGLRVTESLRRKQRREYFS